MESPGCGSNGSKAAVTWAHLCVSSMLCAALKMMRCRITASDPYRICSNQSLWGQVLGIDILAKCKGGEGCACHLHTMTK